MTTVDVTVRLQALDGTWETCGADRAISVLPESLTASSNEWGNDKASFDLHRSPIAIWPDLSAYTPVEIEIGGVIVWEGRIAETPTHTAQTLINVQCLGWQYHLDDDVYQRCYVHSKLTDWKDTRSFLEADLTAFRTSGTVQSGNGQITLGYPKGAAITNSQGVAVTLDLGPGTAGAVFASIDSTLVGTPTNFTLYAMGHTGFVAGSGFTLPGREDIFAAVTPSNTTYGGVAIPARRYLTILLFYAGAEATLAADLLVTLTGIRVFSSTSYETSGTSILHASTVALDALERATLLLSSDVSNVQATSFAIPDFNLAKASTPREAIEAANAYHNWVAKMLSGRRLSFAARPTDPVLELGAWSGADIEDASANSGAEIYNRALVEATGPDGSPLVVERTAIHQPGVVFLQPESPSPDNPSFTTNTEHWTASGGGTITRVTAAEQIQSAPGAGRWLPSAVGQTLTGTFSGTFQKGVQYGLTFYIKRALAADDTVALAFGNGADVVTVNPFVTSGAFVLVRLVWQPTADRTGASLILTTAKANGVGIDTLVLAVGAPTLVDRRLFRRTKVIQMSSAITAAEGTQLGDVFLQSHMTTPFKGSAGVTPGGARRVLGGQRVHPSLLLLATQELIRLSHLTDPDTGGIGRDGTIAEVTYTHKDQKAQVTLDDKRASFDALLARLAVVQTPGS